MPTVIAVVVTYNRRDLLAEALGAEVIAHFPMQAHSAAGSASLRAARDGDAPLLDRGGDGEAMLTARLSPRSSVRSGQPLVVAVDVERLHYFDPETEDAIW